MVISKWMQIVTLSWAAMQGGSDAVTFDLSSRYTKRVLRPELRQYVERLARDRGEALDTWGHLLSILEPWERYIWCCIAITDAGTNAFGIAYPPVQ
jgi:hypothetical protein